MHGHIIVKKKGNAYFRTSLLSEALSLFKRLEIKFLLHS